MPTGAEALGQQSAMQATLDSGVEQLSAKQQVQFQQFTKVVLQQDGFVFWVATGQIMTAIGSLHYATDRMQAEDETIGANQMLFTSEIEITQFNLVSPTSMWIGSWPISGSAPLKVAFARRGQYYEEANIWHYDGFAVYPALESQIIESAADIPAGPIVSNSLPIWLAQNQMAPVYPSFLVPDNVVPPYIVAHIPPESTEALAAAPLIGPWPGTIEPNSGASPLHQLAASQLMRDHVTITLYGFSNETAWQYLVSLYETSYSGAFGFANSPAIQDAKRTQVELAALAQKKQFTIEANYYQGTADAIARRLILSASLWGISLIGGLPATGTASGMQDEQTGSVVGEVFE